MRSTVDLPDPDGPMIVTFSPGRDLEIELVKNDEAAERSSRTLSKTMIGSLISTAAPSWED